MKVSITVPTYNRSAFFEGLYRCFQHQTYKDIELLIYDDSPERTSFFDEKNNPRVKYFYSENRLTIGEKRNYLIEMAEGEVIVHFDDDDFYAPRYVEYMLSLFGTEYDFVKLSGWFVYQVENKFLGYWDTKNDSDDCFLVAPATPVQFVRLDGKGSSLTGFGFSYAYKKQVYKNVQYGAINFGEDYEFITGCTEHGYKLYYCDDPGGMVLHIIHTSNTSRAFPQYSFPPHLVTRLFGREVLEYIQE